MIKLKDILLENPSDYVDKDIDKMDILYKKKKYEKLSISKMADIAYKLIK